MCVGVNATHTECRFDFNLCDEIWVRTTMKTTEFAQDQHGKSYHNTHERKQYCWQEIRDSGVHRNKLQSKSRTLTKQGH